MTAAAPPVRWADISVVVPAWNDGDVAQELAGHLLGQTLRPAEVVLIDDGSDPGHRVADFPLTKQRLNLAGFSVYIGGIRHLGASAARNEGVRRATKSLVFFCDADINLYPTCIEKLFSAITTTRSDLAYCKFKSGGGGVLGKPFDREKLKTGNYIGGIALAKKSAIPKEGWDEDLVRFQDWEFWQRMLVRDHREAAFVDEVLFSAPHRAKGISHNSIPHLQARDIVLEKMKIWASE